MAFSNDLKPQEGVHPVAASDIPTKKFPKSARILDSSHFKLMHRNSIRQFGELLSINVRQGRPDLPKLGITVSKKFGKSHDRNRFKRVVREAFRELLSTLPTDLEMNVSPRKNGAILSKQAVLLEIQALLAKILRT
jgi:ribonuclease P protein component